MVFTLQRYIFRELFKVFILAGVALTLILSLGMVLGPVQEYGVGPKQALHLIGYFLPITLTFVLPLSALFASSLVYGRFAADNELTACKASGISFTTLVYPGLFLAIVVAIANLVLSFHVMPVFVKNAVKSTQADAKQILFRNIQRRGYFEMPPDDKFLIYADIADSKTDTLSGVIIIERAGAAIESIITADGAKIHFLTHDNYSEVQIKAYNVYKMGNEKEGGFYFGSIPITREFGSLIEDDIKFKKLSEIKEIQKNMMLFHPIEKLAKEAYAQFGAELLAQDICSEFEKDANNPYILRGDPNNASFTADHCGVAEENTIELSGNVRVKEFDAVSGSTYRTLTCSNAILRIEGNELAPTLKLDLNNPQYKLSDGTIGLAQRHIVRGLLVPESVDKQFITEDILKAVSPAATAKVLTTTSPRLRSLQNGLLRKILKTQVGITAETNARLVFGIGCVPLIMIGIAFGVIKKDGHLLSAFGISAITAAVLIVCIMMGKNITKNIGPGDDLRNISFGVLIMWSGLAFLVVTGVFVYRKLLKN
ncbi:MAG TPA: LptF/LptG family permease [Sedimentisphaerales bacterium]|nr:LptF/LptG family permease [Sedimentisphaerales bacterium]